MASLLGATIDELLQAHDSWLFQQNLYFLKEINMLEDIKGIGPKTLKLFQNLNIFTIQDLITYYPYKYKLYHPVTLDNFEENTEVLI